LSSYVSSEILGVCSVYLRSVLFVFAFFATSVGVTKVGYPAVWLRVTDSSFEILAMGFVVDTLIWLTVSLIISAVIHVVKK